MKKVIKKYMSLFSTYLSQETATKLDEALFVHFPVIQLMELAGLAVAQCVQDCFPIVLNQSHVLILCGPGNKYECVNSWFG